MTEERDRLYGDLAYIWPLVSDPAEYTEEANYWRRELLRHLGTGRHRLLELGVGGGHHLSHLAGEFDAVAVDPSEGMLAHSRRLNPGVRHQVGDMRTVRLGEQFDAVLVHDAIAYMTTEDDLLAAFKTARVHLREGGVFITAPDFYRDTFTSPVVHHETRRRAGTELTYVEYSTEVDASSTRMETVFVFFIKEAGRLRVELDRHVTGLFPIATWQRLLEETGFVVERVEYPISEDGRPMFLWVGRLDARGPR